MAIVSVVTVAASTSAYAAMPANANLQFIDGVIDCVKGDPGTPPDSCVYGTRVTGGSYFGMDTDGDGNIIATERTELSVGSVGLNIDKTQTGAGDIDATWLFFGNAGNHTSVSNIAILSDDSAGNVTLDFSGWNVT